MGRPKTRLKGSKSCSFLLERKVHDLLKVQTVIEHKDMSNIVNDTLKDYLEAHQPKLDLRKKG